MFIECCISVCDTLISWAQVGKRWATENGQQSLISEADGETSECVPVEIKGGDLHEKLAQFTDNPLVWKHLSKMTWTFRYSIEPTQPGCTVHTLVYTHSNLKVAQMVWLSNQTIRLEDVFKFRKKIDRCRFFIEKKNALRFLQPGHASKLALLLPSNATTPGAQLAFGLRYVTELELVGQAPKEVIELFMGEDMEEPLS